MVVVENNNLSGMIPAWIGESLADLEILRLHSNEFNGIIPLSLCNLASIHVLDLSHNNISGALPHCFYNISVLAGDITTEIIWLAKFQSITSMTELKSLNLSRNHMRRKLPADVGNMKMLESLDLSRNILSGNNPATFLRLNFLGVLDVSHNQLSGRIPPGTQLQSFNASAYTGNLALCGPPLIANCSGNGTTQADDIKEHNNDGLINLGFLISVGIY
ncbi:receptor-like protein EIX2 [Argentina anserina]|uniref:receptor-like protein EIX2 n=1 Tax=Argentina anserina TaxID=57926 RepID=UPI0021763863|nr:receptor-like protein EIX2 [Potentilla anserina]